MSRERDLLDLISEYAQLKSSGIPEGSDRNFDDIADEFGQVLRGMDMRAGEEVIPPIVQREPTLESTVGVPPGYIGDPDS